jgi:hypothetical protein
MFTAIHTRSSESKIDQSVFAKEFASNDNIDLQIVDQK